MRRLIAVFMITLFIFGCSDNQLAYPIKESASSSTALDDVSANTSAIPSKTVESMENRVQSTNAYYKNRNDITTPILIKGLFVGGLMKGKWMHYDEFYNSGVVNFDGYQYNVYVNDTKKEIAAGGLPIHSKSGETLTGDNYISGFDIIHLYDENNQAVDYDIAINADWNIYPRSYSNQDTTQKCYCDLVKNILIEEGLKSPDTILNQVIQVDLEGDGAEEVLITADNAMNGTFKQVMKGDNAIVIFQKLVNGKAVDQVVEKDIRLYNEEAVSLYRLLFRIEAFSDLDGDGIMEVIIKSWYYEGEEWLVYKLIDNQLELVASNGTGA